jgi:hypothetical protein
VEWLYIAHIHRDSNDSRFVVRRFNGKEQTASTQSLQVTYEGVQSLLNCTRTPAYWEIVDFSFYNDFLIAFLLNLHEGMYKYVFCRIVANQVY